MTDGVPNDSFAIRLAVVRTMNGWNYHEAQMATGINAETWRLWEKGTRQCKDITGNARKISAATGRLRKVACAGRLAGTRAGPGWPLSDCMLIYCHSSEPCTLGFGLR